MSLTSKVILMVVVGAIIVGGSFYYWQSKKVEVDQQTTKEDYSIIKIQVPENYDEYKQVMTEYAQVGGQDPLLTMEFVEKEITIPYTDDLINASAQASAEEIAPVGGPTNASIAYLKVQDNTAYVLLDIDLDGWAGVSVSIAIIHPLVEKTLMQFSEITSVVFDYAPGDK